MLQTENHIFTGLQQDTSVSKQNPEYLIDAHNIRITAREGETLLSITNERGPKQLQLKSSSGSNVSISGTILGHCVLNNYLVLFIHDEGVADSILRIDMSKDEPEVINLYQGASTDFLGFNVSYPIEAIGDYENENIQKVYWTDGLNQPRIINIANRGGSDSPRIYTWQGSFDFVPELSLNEDVTVSRNTGASGQFPAGVIQYAFSYYNKYGQESNIFYTTPLYYTSYYDRGASPETVVSNAFNITVNGVDSHFDYLRIYSIMRTSLDATPVCKRLIDIAIDSLSGGTAKYIDTGTNGSNVDPTSLLYIGGEEVVAKNLCAKDGTLFLGNLKINRPNITAISNFVYNIQSSPSVSTVTKTNSLTSVTSSNYAYANGLNTQAAGFKNREYYRLGFQAQYKNGKWSEPIFIKDYQVSNSRYPSLTSSSLTKLGIRYVLPAARCSELIAAGYKKVRPVVVFPDVQDRTIVCQGVVNPTMYTYNHRYSDKDMYAQSSWFFRPMLHGVTDLDTLLSMHGSTTTNSPISKDYSYLPYSQHNWWNPKSARLIEIQGDFISNNQFQIDWSMTTLHSPEITFDDSIQHLDLSSVKCRVVGKASFTKTFSDISLLTSSPTASNSGAGFVHKSFTSDYAKGIVSGLFYDDFVVDDYDSGTKFRPYTGEKNPCKWLVYPWQKNGSITNDFNRPANGGDRTAVLSKKVISNLRYANTIWSSVTMSENKLITSHIPQVFSSNEVSIVKLSDKIYEGNIDTLLAPDDIDGLYYCYGNQDPSTSYVGPNLDADASTPFTSKNWWKTYSEKADEVSKQGLYKWMYDGSNWQWRRWTKDIADYGAALAVQKEPVRMKYKSTPHIVLYGSSLYNTSLADSTDKAVLPIVELYKDYNSATAFGGTSQDALRANKWVPAGKAIALSAANKNLDFEYGDTWYSRYDCLKTYSFTPEDPNQIIEIGSFMLETHVNIDGRYDRNRGQVNNLNMSPTNFNLINKVYSQRDNFFSYFILDDDYYKLNQFPNQITWSTEKHAGADIDEWTSVTLASTYNLDGSKGQIQSLNVWSDTIYCFQDMGVSHILFNSRVQIPTSDGVPIEIANNYKVDGKRYISDGIGCINKYTICSTPIALYFVDSVGGHLQAITQQGVTDISLQNNMVTWLGRQNMSMWKPNEYSLKTFYDKNNGDLYIVSKDEALCYNEPISQFTSFMSYDNIPVMFNVIDRFYCLKSNYLHEMFKGEYNYFFGDYQGYDFTFVANGKTSEGDLSTYDKMYSNMDFRADKWSDKLDSILSSESPFDYVRVWNEYQDTGEVLLHSTPDKPSVLKKKFRVWRIAIPRDAHNRRDRMRNTWCKVKLGAAPRYNNGNNGFIQFHDVAMQYFV